MIVLKLSNGEIHYYVAALTKELAISGFEEEVDEEYQTIEEVPESEWDRRFITMYEDNNPNSEPFLESIRDVLCGTDWQMICNNNSELTAY